MCERVACGAMPYHAGLVEITRPHGSIRHGPTHPVQCERVNRVEHAQYQLPHSLHTCYNWKWPPGAKKLIEIWGDDQIQAQLEGCKQNQNIFAKISLELSKEGYERTTQQCRDKIKKLKVEYRKIRIKERKQERIEWDFFDVLDEILGHKPASAPPIVVNSLVSTNEGELNELEPEVESIGTPELHEGSVPSTSSERKDIPSDMPESNGYSSMESGQDEASRPTTASLTKGKKESIQTQILMISLVSYWEKQWKPESLRAPSS